MDIGIYITLYNIFAICLASNIMGESQGQSSVVTDINAKLIERLEENDKLVQSLLGRMKYLETREKELQTEVHQLGQQLRDQGQRATYLERLLKRKSCTCFARKIQTEELNFENDNNDAANIKATTSRNIKDDVINKRIRRQNPEDPIAFFAAITNHVTHAGAHQTFVFDNAITNLGSAYNSHNGNFVAPLDGTYVFSVTLMSLYHANAHVMFYKNGQPVSRLYVSGGEAGYDTTSQTIILQLTKGDDVCVQNIDLDVSMAGANYSTFAGFLLQEGIPATVVLG
ncbi:uncharacterized protein LOC132718432 [Ruditapes philippinarum]|uniref:uncharacterized protein LOC132718432 n=1 Tax=Ruditapes philippinarum TaxID=129788 RepID=UPI00295C1512|nr:uncharacterized protein LOC132718432 [Ruditapes philippinarum]